MISDKALDALKGCVLLVLERVEREARFVDFCGGTARGARRVLDDVLVEIESEQTSRRKRRPGPAPSLNPERDRVPSPAAAEPGTDLPAGDDPGEDSE